jgi:hypothetical protein
MILGNQTKPPLVPLSFEDAVRAALATGTMPDTPKRKAKRRGESASRPYVRLIDGGSPQVK